MNVSVAELSMMDDIDTFNLGLLHIGDEENMEILESLCGSSWYTDEAAETSTSLYCCSDSGWDITSISQI